MVELLESGDLPNIPDEPGVYAIVCAFGGNSSYRLGDIVYIGVSNSLRRRVAYAIAAPRKSAPHPAQEPLMRFQARGGVAKVIYCLLDHAVVEGDLEVAMIEEYKSRTGNMPAWNRTKPRKTTGNSRARRIAEEVLDRLAVGRPK